MNTKDKSLYASLIINSLNDATVWAAYLGITLDDLIDSVKECYNIQKELIDEADPEVAFKQEVVAPKTIEKPNRMGIRVGQVYDIPNDGYNGQCVITKVDRSDISMRWLTGRYGENSIYRDDSSNLDFFYHDNANLVSESPLVAPGQIWKGRWDLYYLIVKRTDHTSPYNSNGQGWEVKVSNDLKNPFRWLCDYMWTESCADRLTFVGYKDDLGLDSTEFKELING